MHCMTLLQKEYSGPRDLLRKFRTAGFGFVCGARACRFTLSCQTVRRASWHQSPDYTPADRFCTSVQYIGETMAHSLWRILVGVADDSIEDGSCPSFLAKNCLQPAPAFSSQLLSSLPCPAFNAINFPSTS
jgi:hypothetical protein